MADDYRAQQRERERIDRERVHGGMRATTRAGQIEEFTLNRAWSPPPAPQKAPVQSMPVLPFIPPWTPLPMPPLKVSMEAPPVHAAPAYFPDPLDAPDAPRTLQSWVLDFAASAGLFGLVMGTFESSGSLWQIAIWTIGFATLGAWAGVLRWGMERVFGLVSDALDAVLDACVKPLGLATITGGAALAVAILRHL